MIALVSEVIGAFVGRGGVKEGTDASACWFDGLFWGLSEQVFQLGDDLPDRIEVWAVGRREQQARIAPRSLFEREYGSFDASDADARAGMAAGVIASAQDSTDGNELLPHRPNYRLFRTVDHKGCS